MRIAGCHSEYVNIIIYGNIFSNLLRSPLDGRGHVILCHPYSIYLYPRVGFMRFFAFGRREVRNGERYFADYCYRGMQDFFLREVCA